MPKYVVTAPDGRKLQVTAPEGATTDQVRARAQQAYTGGSAAVGAGAPPDERGDFRKGVARGMDNMQGMTYGFAALLGDTVGHEGLTEWGLEGYQRNQQEAALSAPRVGSIREVQGVGDFFDFAQGVIGETAPFSLTTIAGGGVGGLLAKAAAKRLVAKGISEELAKKSVTRILKDETKRKALEKLVKKGTTIEDLAKPLVPGEITGRLVKAGAAAGSFAASAATQQGGLYAELKEAGVDDAMLPAWAYGAGMGALDVLPELMLANKLLSPKTVSKELSKSFARGLAGEVGKTAAKQGAAEAVTESLQEGLALHARLMSDEKFQWDDKANERLLDAAVAGAIAGVFLGGAGGGIVALTTKREEKTKNATDTRRPGAPVASPAGQTGAAQTAAPAAAGVPPGSGGVVEPGDGAAAPAEQSAVAPSATDVPGVSPAVVPAAGTPAAGSTAEIAGAPNDQGAPVGAADGGSAPAVPPAGIAPQTTPGVTDDTVSIEPMSQLTAQFRDTRNSKAGRKATLVPTASLQHYGDERIEAMARGVKGEARLVPVEDADGKGGVLYATPRGAQEFVRRKMAGENIDALIGEFTGADPLGQGGKPVTDQPAVVQRKDAEGAVVQETVVAPQDVPAAVAAVGQEPGQVTVASPEEVVAQRESEVRAEEQPDPPLTDEIADLDREIQQAIDDSRMAGHIAGLQRLRAELQEEARAASAPRRLPPTSEVAKSGLFSQLSPEHLTAWLNAHGARIFDQTEDSTDVLQTRANFFGWFLSDAPTAAQRATYTAWLDSSRMDLGMGAAEESLLRQITGELPGVYKDKALKWLGAKRDRMTEILRAKQARSWPIERVVYRVLELAIDRGAANVYREAKSNEILRDKRNAIKRREALAVFEPQDEEQASANQLTGWEIDRPAFSIGKGLNSDDGVIHGQKQVRRDGRGPIQATPWAGEDAEMRALNAATLRQLQDPDATYIAERLTKERAAELGLPAAGWWVLAYPHVSGDLLYSKAAGGQRTPAALTRLRIANAKNRWDKIPRHLKEDMSEHAPLLGLHVTLYDEAGNAVGTDMLVAEEIVRLGFDLEPSLRANKNVSSKHRMLDAFHIGIAAIMDFSDRGKRMRVTALEPGAAGLPRNLVLRQGNPKRFIEEVTLGSVVGRQKTISSGVYTSASARYKALNPNKTAEPEKLLPPVFDRAGTPVAAVVDPYSDEIAPYQIDETTGEIVPMAQVEGAVDTRGFEDEERQNRRSTTEIDPADTIGGSQRRERSAMGVAPGGAAPTVLGQGPTGGPTAAPVGVDPVARRMTEGALQREPGKGLSQASPAPAIDPSREMRPTYVAERDAPVFTSMSEGGFDMTVNRVVKALHDLMKLRGNLVVTDNLADAVRLAGWRNIDANRVQAAWARMQNANAGGVVVHSGDQHLIILNPARPQEASFKTLAHEIGHVFWNETYAGAPRELREALGEAYRRFADANPALIAESIKRGQLYDINEWMADQVAAWVYTDKKPRSAIEKFFHSVATTLQQVYEYLRGRGYNLDATAQLFIQYSIAGDTAGSSGTVDPAFDSLGAANDTSFDMNVAPRAQPAWQRKAWEQFRALKLKYPTVGKMADFLGESMLGLHNIVLARVFKRVERMAPDADHPFRKIMREFYTNVGEKLTDRAAGAASFYSDRDGRLQAFSTRFRSITDKLGEREKNELLLEAMRERAIDPGFKHAAKLEALRAMFKDIREYMLKAGLPINDVTNYFPQVYDKDALASPDAVKDIAERLARDGVVNFVTGQPYTETEVQALFDGMLDDSFAVNFAPDAQIDPSKDTDAPFAQAMRARKFPEEFRNAIRSILDSSGQPKYMSKSLDYVVTTYIQQSVTRAEYNRRFGDATWAQRLASWEVLDAAGKEKFPKPVFDPHFQLKLLLDDAAKNWSASGDQLAFMNDVMSAMLGQYQRIENPAVRKLTNGMMLFQNMRTLLFVVFASFPDVANVFVRTGEFKDTFRSMRAVAKAALKGEMNDALRMYGHAADSFDSTIMRELVDLRDSDSKVWKLNEQWFRAVGLHRWTNFVRGMGLNVSQDYLVKHAERVIDGHPDAADSQRRLDELGVSAQDVQAWAVHKKSYFQEGGPQDDATRRVTAAIQRLVNDMVIHPTPPEKTLWGNAETMKLFWHLKSFMYGFTTRVLGRAFHEFQRNGATTQQQLLTAGALTMLLPLAAVGLLLRDILQYWIWGRESYTPYDDPLAYLGVLAGRSGVTGTGQMAVDIWQAGQRGRAPMLALTGPTVTWMNDWMEYPLYKTVPSSIPVLSSFPGARDAIRDWAKEE
jgi:hypothetical protein